MSKTDEATQNPNDKMPEGKPLDPDVIVPDGDAGDAQQLDAPPKKQAGEPAPSDAEEDDVDRLGSNH